MRGKQYSEGVRGERCFEGVRRRHDFEGARKVQCCARVTEKYFCEGVTQGPNFEGEGLCGRDERRE